MVGRVPGDDQLPRVGDAVTRAQCQAPIKSQLIRSVGLAGPSSTSRQITFRTLSRSHLGSGPSRGGPIGIIAVPFLLVANRSSAVPALIRIQAHRTL